MLLPLFSFFALDGIQKSRAYVDMSSVCYVACSRLDLASVRLDAKHHVGSGVTKNDRNRLSSLRYLPRRKDEGLFPLMKLSAVDGGKFIVAYVRDTRDGVG